MTELGVDLEFWCLVQISTRAAALTYPLDSPCYESYKFTHDDDEEFALLIAKSARGFRVHKIEADRFIFSQGQPHIASRQGEDLEEAT